MGGRPSSGTSSTTRIGTKARLLAASAAWGWLLAFGLWIGIWPRVRVGILGLVLLVAMTGPLIRHYWETLSVDGRIAVMRWRYEQAAREWEARTGAGPLAGPPVQRIREGYLVDIGPPMRLAVPLPDSPVAGRCYALVYDPSDFVLETQRFAADGSNWNDPELAPVKRRYSLIVSLDRLSHLASAPQRKRWTFLSASRLR